VRRDSEEATLLRNDPNAQLTTTRVASFPPPIPENPYQRLLYESLRAFGVELVESDRFYAGWLARNVRRVDALHFHWPTPYYRHELGRPALRPVLSWIRVCLFACRLLVARLLGYRIVWTVHEVYPHETTSRLLDKAAARLLARTSNALITHDDATAALIEESLRPGHGKVVVIPHATFAGVYVPGRDRSLVRSELGVSQSAFVFLCFGHVRDYKDLDVLVRAFGAVTVDNVALVVSGLPLSEQAAGTLRKAARDDPRIKVALAYVPDEQVAELFAASDVAVVSRGDGGTSGVLVLALSLGVPVIAADRPAYQNLTAQGEAGWHFEPGSAVSLTGVLESAARSPAAVNAKAGAAAKLGAAMRWSEAAARVAAVLRGAPSSE
jgi:glycosyltransferase involved in cell wall biosynthesis